LTSDLAAYVAGAAYQVRRTEHNVVSWWISYFDLALELSFHK
jgi:molybdopterin/thiamine biosynthesis adenylyltransferase